ncbi:MAG: hypothetical protein MJ252_04785 [archaeon]|nr:hypothetical protein [archaeon]
MSTIRLGELFDLQRRKTSELISFLYGGLIVRLYKDLEDPEEINKKIEEIGFNMGQRLIDDVLVNMGKLEEVPKSNFVDKIIGQIFSNFLGIPEFNFNQTKENEYDIVFKTNPLNLYVELPEKLKPLWYSNIICGILRGAFNIIYVEVETKYEKDTLKGDDVNLIKFSIKQYLEEKFVDDE